jgi:ribose transport system permease protein
MQRGSIKKFFNWAFSTKEITALIVLVAIVGLTSTVNRDFLNQNNIIVILRMMSFTLIASIGVTLTILIGEIDISVGSVAGFGAITSTVFAAYLRIPVPLAIPLALILCAGMATITGTLIVQFKMPPFVAGIAILYVGRAICMIVTNGYPVYPLPESMNKIGLMEPFGTSIAFVAAIVMVIVGSVILKYTVLGRKLYAIGDNKEVARLAGIKVEKIKILTFTVNGVCAGLAGIMQALQMQSGQTNIGQGWELNCIAACAIGGISLLGGAGSLIGTALGMTVMSTLNNALIMLKVNTHWQNVVIGAIMVAAVLLDLFRRTRKVK